MKSQRHYRHCCIVAVLVDDACCLVQVPPLGLWLPPIHQVPLAVELTTSVVESVGQLVTNDNSDTPKVQVVRTTLVVEDALKNNNWLVSFCTKNTATIFLFLSVYDLEFRFLVPSTASTACHDSGSFRHAFGTPCPCYPTGWAEIWARQLLFQPATTVE